MVGDSFAGEDLLDVLLQLGVNVLNGAFTVDNRETVSGLQAAKLFFDQRLVLQKAVEHVAGKADVHAAFPVIQRVILLKISLNQLFRRNVEVKDRVGHQRDAVNVL